MPFGMLNTVCPRDDFTWISQFSGVIMNAFI